MAYALEHHAPVDDDIPRIMSKQLAKARTALDDVDADPERAVHECRKRCKKIRGAVRLVRPAVTGDGYSTVNALARDAARELAEFRDATAMATTLDRLSASGLGAPDDAMARAAAALTARRRAMAETATSERHAVVRATALLAELDEAIDGLRLDAGGFDAIGPGLAKTYGRGREALAAAVAAPTGAAFHEWRKRAKYTLYHVRLLAPSAPAVLGPLQEALNVLGDALGDAHDLVVLGDWLRSDADEVRRLGDVTGLRIVVDGARSEQEHRAVALGRRLYAESPKRFTQRLGAYWDAWDAEATRQPAGELERVLG